MRIGLFGGTFNPVHIGHLRISIEVKDAFSLDKLIFIPCLIPPHKNLQNVADVSDRFEMLAQSLSDIKDFEISEVELKRKGTSYTIDTIKHFYSESQKSTEFYLILGIDAFLEIYTWKSYLNIFDMVNIIVVARPGDNSLYNSAFFKWDLIDNFVKDKISENYKLIETKSCFEHAFKKTIFMFSATNIDISSTIVRQLTNQGKSIKYLVPEPVEKYIVTKGLYK